MNLLLTTKWMWPLAPSTFVPRPRLVDTLNAAQERKLILVSASAGFGKTTLLSSWLANAAWTQPVARAAWLSLDEGDNDPIRFINYLVKALQHLVPDLGKGILDVIQEPQPPSPTTLLTPLINEMIDLTVDIPDHRFLVLDDYHLIKHKTIHNALGFLVDNLPPWIHLIIATRADPPLDLSRLRAQRQLIEIRQTDLSFTPDETRHFMKKIAKVDLSIDEATTLTFRSEGWIAGLQLAAVTMRARLTGTDNQATVRNFVRTFAGSNRYIMDYLMTQVLDQQPPETTQFLLQTAILSRLCGPLCNAVTGRTDSQHILTELEKANLFLIPLDDQRTWYRYHRLFADLLRQQPQQTQASIADLHRKASAWYQEQNMIHESIAHALRARNWAQATTLIEMVVETTWGRGEQVTCARWLDALPDDVLVAHPSLCVFHSLTLFASGQYAAAQARLQAAQRAIEDQPDSTTQAKGLRGMSLAAQAFVAFGESDPGQIIKLSQKALNCLPEDRLTWRGLARYTQGLAQRLHGDLDAAWRTLAESVETSRAAGWAYMALIGELNLAIVRLQQGRLRLGAEILQETLAHAQATGLAQSPVAGLLSAYLSSVQCEWNDLDTATASLAHGLELCEEGQDIGALAICDVLCLRLGHAQGDPDKVLQIIRRLERLQDQASLPPWLIHWITALRAQVWLAQGYPDLATDLLERHGVSLDDKANYLREAEHIALARASIVQNQAGAALPLLQRLLHAAESHRRLGRAIKILLVTALAHQAQDSVEKAMVPLAKALALAEPEGYVQTFAEEGPPMAELLQMTIQQQIQGTGYARQLVQIMTQAPQFSCPWPSLAPTQNDPWRESLTPRELEVLRLLNSELSVNEIAEQLSVARSTIRTHIKHIYGKLNVHSRVEAVVRGQEMGLV